MIGEVREKENMYLEIEDSENASVLGWHSRTKSHGSSLPPWEKGPENFYWEKSVKNDRPKISAQVGIRENQEQGGR